MFADKLKTRIKGEKNERKNIVCCFDFFAGIMHTSAK